MLIVLKWLVIVLTALGLGLIGAGRAGLLRGTAPKDLGVRDGRLKPPSNTDNSVSSQAALHSGRAAADIRPLALRDGDGPATLARIAAAIEKTPGARIVETTRDYLRAEFTTPLLKFVDDAEFWFDPSARVIQVRSASRIGSGDLGANRRRIEALRAALAAAP